MDAPQPEPAPSRLPAHLYAAVDEAMRRCQERVFSPPPPSLAPVERRRLAAQIAWDASDPANRVPLEDRREALHGFWMPTLVRDVWLGVAGRDATLRVLINLARHLLPECPPLPIDLDQSISWRIKVLEREHSTAWLAISDAIDPMLAARIPAATIKRRLAEMAKQAGFGDLDWGPLARSRIEALNRRKRFGRRGA